MIVSEENFGHIDVSGVHVIRCSCFELIERTGPSNAAAKKAARAAWAERAANA